MFIITIKCYEVKKPVHETVETKVPVRADDNSAGLDFHSKENIILKGNKVVDNQVIYDSHKFDTDVKVKLPDDKMMEVHARSSVGTKHHVIIKNGTGIIDPSYFESKQSDGNIGVTLVNMSHEDYEVNIGDRIAQGVVVKFYKGEDEESTGKVRVGGHGSSGK